MQRIVVGIDGSPNAARALRWAAEEARLRGAELHLVHAYQTAEFVAVAMPAMAVLPTTEELNAAARTVLDGVLAEVDVDGIETLNDVRPGPPAAVLLDAADGADLLVVGARGLGGFRGLLLGSVTHQVVAHSPCPVVVITPEQRG